MDSFTPSAIAEETFKNLAPNIRESFTSKASQTPSTGALSISSSTHRSSGGSGGGIHKFTYKELQYGGEDDEDFEKALKIYQPTSSTNKKKGREQRYHSARGVASFVHKEEDESSPNNNYYTQKDMRSTATRSASPDSGMADNNNATHKYSIAPTLFANRSGANVDSFLSYKSDGEEDTEEDGDGGSLHSVRVYSRMGSNEDSDNNSDTNNSAEYNVTQIMDNLSILQADDGGDDNQIQTKGDNTSSRDNKSSGEENTNNEEREGSASAIGIVNSVFKQWMYPKEQQPLEDNVSEQQQQQQVDEDESDDDGGSSPSSQPPLHLSHSNQSKSTTSSKDLINLLIDAYDSSDSCTSNRSKKKGEHRIKKNGGEAVVAVQQQSVKSNGEDNKDNDTKKTSLQSGWRRKKKKKKPPSVGGNEVQQQSQSKKNEDEDAASTTKMSQYANNNVEQQLSDDNVKTHQKEQRQQNWGGLINMFQPNNKVNESRPAEKEKDTGEISSSDQIMPQSTDEAGEEEKIPFFRRIISSSDEPPKHPPPSQSVGKIPSSKSGSGECVMPAVQIDEMVNGESNNHTERGPGDLCTPSTADSNSYTQSSTNNSPMKQNEHRQQAQQIEEESHAVLPFFKRLISGQQENVVGDENEAVVKDEDDDEGGRGISNGKGSGSDHPTEDIMREEGGTRSETYAETLDPVDRTVGPSPLNNSILSSSETLPSFYSSASEISRFRPSLVNDFKKSQTRESFRRSTSDLMRGSESLIDNDGEGNGGVDWPSPVSSLGSPPTVPADEEGEGETQNDDSVGQSSSASEEDGKCNVAAASSRSKESSSNNGNPKEENENIPNASDDKYHEDIPINLEDSRGGHIDFTNCKPPPPPTRSRSYGDASFPVQTAVRNRSQALSYEHGSMDSLDFGDNVDSNESGVDWGKSDVSDRTSGSRYGNLSHSVNSTGFDNALTRTDSVKKKLGKLKASVQSTGSYNMIRSYRKPSMGSRSRQSSVSAMSDLSFGTENSPGVNERNPAPHGVAAATAEDRSNKFSTFYYEQMMQTPDPEVENELPSSAEVQKEKEKVETAVMQLPTFQRELEEEQERPLDVSQSSSKLPQGGCNRVRGRSSIARSDVSSLASFASPVYLEKTRRQSDMMMTRRERSDSSLSSMDSLASPTQQMATKKGDQGAMIETAPEEMNDETSGNNVIDNVQVDIPIYGDEMLPLPGPRHQMARSFHSEKSSSFHRPERPLPRRSSAKLSEKSDSFKLEESSLTMDDLNSINGDNLNSYKASGLANDVALHLEHSTKSLNTSFFSTDGIDYIDPSATSGEGREDFDFALNAYTNAISHGHFDFHDNKATLDGALEGSDEVLAARGYLGLGFARQCKGELESSLNAYTTFLALWEHEMGSNDPLIASVQFTIGTVLIEMQRQLEAADHFTKALHLYKRNDSTTDGGNRASILSTEGMLFSVLGEGSRAIDCLRQAVLVYQTAHQSMNLKFATVMFEMGSLLSQMGKYEDSGNCFSFALEIRKALLGDSFVVARTHYSLGVTLASQELEANTNTASATHLEEALRICEEEFESDHVQSAIIVHALGVLNERKGDFLTASVWFAKEHAMRKILFGEDHESVASVCADLGTCYYNSGKYELAISTFEDDLRIILLSDNDRSLEVAEALYKIASCHDSLCNYDEALEKFYEVKRIRESLFGVESCPVIQTMLRIGNIQLCKGEVKKALDCFSEVLGIGYASDSVNAVEVANALYGRGCAQFCLFNLTDAMKSLSESLNWKLAALGEDDPGLACIFYQMAHVYLEQSEPEEAITCFEEYARLQKLEKQRNLHDNAEICYAEGIVAKLKGQQDAALSFYNQALAMFDTLFGGEHEKVASIHFDIGCAHSAMGDHEAALGHFQTCLIQRRKLLGCHVDVAYVLYEIASIFSQQNQAQLAVKCMTEADRIWNEKLENNEKLSSVLLLSGKMWKSLQCYQAAEENFEQALEQAITIYGQEHELVAQILLNLGELLHEINQMQQALFCFDESIQVRTALYGPDSPSVAQAEYSKGVALLFHGNFEDATACLDRALAIRREHFGPTDVDVGDILNTMGFLQLRMGNIFGEEVLDPLKEALEIRRAIGNKSKVVSTLQNIASVYKKRKDYDSCLATHAEILMVRQEEFGSNDVRVSDAWMSLGNIQTIAGRLDEATVSYEEALRIRTLINGYNHTSVAHVLFKIGSIKSRQSNYTGAKQLFEEYIRIRAEEEDDPDEEMAQALTLMGDLQKETNEKSKAQINWMSALEIYQQLGYPDTHPKLTKLRSRVQSSKSSMMNFFGGGSQS